MEYKIYKVTEYLEYKLQEDGDHPLTEEEYKTVIHYSRILKNPIFHEVHGAYVNDNGPYALALTYYTERICLSITHGHRILLMIRLLNRDRQNRIIKIDLNTELGDYLMQVLRYGTKQIYDSDQELPEQFRRVKKGTK